MRMKEEAGVAQLSTRKQYGLQLEVEKLEMKAIKRLGAERDTQKEG